MPDEGKQIKRMADILKSGGAMLQDICPECSSPLFKTKDEVWCMNCNKRVVIVKEGEPTPDLKDARETVLNDVEEIVLTKLHENSQQIKNEADPTRLQELGSLLSTWFEVLERLKKLQKQSS